jgi:hypothetical protein
MRAKFIRTQRALAPRARRAAPGLLRAGRAFVFSSSSGLRFLFADPRTNLDFATFLCFSTTRRKNTFEFLLCSHPLSSSKYTEVSNFVFGSKSRFSAVQPTIGS